MIHEMEIGINEIYMYIMIVDITWVQKSSWWRQLDQVFWPVSAAIAGASRHALQRVTWSIQVQLCLKLKLLKPSAEKSYCKFIKSMNFFCVHSLYCVCLKPFKFLRICFFRSKGNKGKCCQGFPTKHSGVQLGVGIAYGEGQLIGLAANRRHSRRGCAAGQIAEGGSRNREGYWEISSYLNIAQ